MTSRTTPEIERLREELNRQPPMTDAQREIQRRSFAYGNVAIENPRVTRALVNEQADRIKRTTAR